MSSGRCDIWWARASDADLVDYDDLSDLERAREARFRTDADRARFVVGAMLLRITLARTVGASVRGLTVDRKCPHCGDQHWKPTVPGSNVDVSVAHASDWVVVAVAEGARVGVDVEPRGRSLADIGAMILAPEERRAAAGSDHELLRIWTRKEATLKAAGVGLSAPPNELVVLPGDPAEIRRLPHGVELPTPATILDLDAPRGAVAAIAVAGAQVQRHSRDGSALLRRHAWASRRARTVRGGSKNDYSAVVEAVPDVGLPRFVHDDVPADPLPADVLDHMTPTARALMENALREPAAGAHHPNVSRRPAVTLRGTSCARKGSSSGCTFEVQRPT